MGILQKVFADQFFKISLVHLLSKGSKCFSEFEVNKGGLLVVEPCVERPEAVDQSLGIIAGIGLSVFKLKPVDARQKRALVKPLVRDLSERVLYGPDKLFFLVGICILGGNSIAGLSDAKFQQGIYIFANPLVAQRFFDRSAFGVAEHVVDDLEGEAKFCVLTVLSQRYVPCKITAAFQFLL